MSRRAHTQITDMLTVCVRLDPEPGEAFAELSTQVGHHIISRVMDKAAARQLADVLLRALEVSG